MNTIATRESALKLREAAVGLPLEIDTLKQGIVGMEELLKVKKELMYKIIQEHNLQVRVLAEEEAEKRGVGFCCECKSIMPSNKLSLVLVSGMKWGGHGRTCGYGNTFRSAQRLCPTCYSAAMKRSGWKGLADSVGRQDTYFAWPIQRRDKKFFIDYADERTADVTCEVNELPFIPKDLISDLVQEWDLPKLLKIKEKYDGDEWIIASVGEEQKKQVCVS